MVNLTVRHFLLYSKEGMRHLITEVGEPPFKGVKIKQTILVYYFGVYKECGHLEQLNVCFSIF